jgi:hypothetical protein
MTEIKKANLELGLEKIKVYLRDVGVGGEPKNVRVSRRNASRGGRAA